MQGLVFYGLRVDSMMHVPRKALEHPLLKVDNLWSRVDRSSVWIPIKHKAELNNRDSNLDPEQVQAHHDPV